MFSCFGSRRQRLADEEEPLLSQYDDDTSLQRQLHQKLHTYQMLRALSKGFMPSTEQAIVNLRTLLSADILNPENPDLSDSGRALVHYSKQFITQLIELLKNKNSKDQIQDFIWSLSKARVSVDYEHIAERASRAKTKADTAAMYQSVKTVGSLLLTNSDFRLFLADLNIVAREVFKDTAFALSEASKEAGERLEPSTAERESLKHPGSEANGKPTEGDVAGQVAEVTDVLGDSVSKVAAEAEQSIVDKFTGVEKDTMLQRLKQAVMKLRQRRDYSDSVSTVSLLLKRYAMVYARIGDELQEVGESDVDSNSAMDKAMRNLWLLIRSFGETQEWDKLEESMNKVMDHGKTDPEFEKLVTELGNATQDMLSDPDFFDHAEDRFSDLRARSSKLADGSSSTLREDIDIFLAQLRTTYNSFLHDQDIAKLLKTATIIFKILSPSNHYANTDLVQDSLNVFVPLFFQAISYIPVPRLEISTPDVDLLLENLILEPGIAINHSSFLPYKLRIETYNDLSIRKARFRTASALKSLVRVSIDGFSIRAEEVGFWMRAHSGLLRFVDQGIASFALDERGIDIQLDMEIGKDRMDKILSLRSVRVRIHKLNYTLRSSKFSLLAWLFKPLLKPVIRATMEMQLATAIGEGLKLMNRELLYARERLRATRIADPDDLTTFVKAVMARLAPPEDPDVQARIGVGEPGGGVFEGRYAPGSVVKLWKEEAEQAKQRIREGEQERGGWRNNVFDVHATMLT